VFDCQYILQIRKNSLITDAGWFSFAIQAVEYYNLKLRITPNISKACKGEIMSKEMEKRLKALEDLEEIRNLHNEYIFFLNNRQWDDMADSFTSDAFADIHGQCKGREEIAKRLKSASPN
jgi:hypothetical protein